MGDKLYYVHNETAKSNNFLTTQVLNEGSEFGHDLLFKDMDRMVAEKLVFMPALGLQVGDKEVIMPCRNGRYICFAKINY